MDGWVAIQTEFDGCKFRSRIEARHAVFFNALGIQWNYEVEGHQLSHGRYLPDFWLPELDCWIEIKGKPATDREIDLASSLCIATGKSVYIFAGDLKPPTCGRDPISAQLIYPMVDPGGVTEAGYDEPYRWCQCHFCERYGICFEGRSNRLPCKSSTCQKAGGHPDKGYNSSSQSLIGAYKTASSARFEFGEVG